MTLIDTHAHIEGEEFDSDREEVVRRALDAGVSGWINISNGLDSFRRSCELAEKHDGIYVSLGIHPHEAAETDRAEWNELAKKIDHPKVVAVGETGLDYFYENSPKDRQKDLFRFFLNLSKESGLPLSIHIRDAEADLLDCVDRVFPNEVKGVIHCFSSTPEFARDCLKRGFYISFSGIVTFKKAEPVREAAREVPLDKLLVETDAPYLAPEPLRGKRNEPAYVVKTAEKIAELKGISLEELARKSTENAKKLFGI